MQNSNNKSVQLSPQTCAEIDKWIAKYPPEQKQSAVLSALTIVQHENGGFLTSELMDAVADYLDMAKISVYEVATFYSMFELEPVGRHMVSVCNNISCMLCGGDEIISHIEKKYEVRLGGTSRDGKITLKREEECLAACAGAPMMAVNGHYHEHLTPEKVDAILDGLE